MKFNEINTTEHFILNELTGISPELMQDSNYLAPDSAFHPGLKWQYVPSSQLKREAKDAIVESLLKDALIRLNPDIAADPNKADEVLYKIRAIFLSVGTSGLVRANEEFSAWLRGDKTMPFGENNEHVSISFIDFDSLGKNTYIVTNQYTVQGKAEKRPDLVMLVNGIPLVVGEFKTPVRPSISWLDGAIDIHDDYENTIPQLFVPNVFSFATEGKTFRYGSIRMPLELWGPWRDSKGAIAGLSEIKQAISGALDPGVVLDLLQNFTLFATDKRKQRIKIIARYQQMEGANLIIERVKAGRPKKGLIWHFQGSGKSLLMVFAAQKLRRSQELKSPTVLVVVDRVDLDTQITGTFNATEIPNVVSTDKRSELHDLLNKDTRKIIITTIFKFAEAGGVLNERENIIVLVDEAHRTQEGDLGRKMRDALPNAFLFGLTGTPINKTERNTFWAFGAEEDDQGYMTRYTFQDSIRDKATLPLHFEPRLLNVHVDRDLIDAEFDQMTEHLSEDDRTSLVKEAAKMSAFLKSPARIETIVKDVVKHFQEKIDSQGFKAQIVTPDRYACDLYKQELDKILPPEASAVVISTGGKGETDTMLKQKYEMSKEDQEKLLDNFRDPEHPLKFLIVTAKLLTGFDAPILQCMYLDKALKDHNLLQAICRTNRVYKDKAYGLVVDYFGVFDDVAKALEFDDASVRYVITNLNELKNELQGAVNTCLGHFHGIDRSVVGYEGLLLAQDCLNTDEKRDAYAADYSVLSKIWEALSPDPILNKFQNEYTWLSQVYESVRPPSGETGRLLWHALGAQTMKLIHEHIHVQGVDDHLEEIVLDAEVIEDLMHTTDKKKIKLIEIEITKRFLRHKGDPRFVALGQRLEELRDKAERGLINSIEFLKDLIQLAKETVQAEKEVETETRRDGAKTALSELFLELKTDQTPVIVERIVNDIDGIVKVVRFPGWQSTAAGEREIKQALRKTLYKYALHKDNILFDKAYEYIRQYY
ncbi:MAG: DEAD/DEAH box helicase [Candidatus Lloydbacteria bacterium RIFCSPHIGHO2_01_FULL_49_22]|uniref:Type I restriction enzyme endonuclease subunit n=1 Tax=Candidatus Lloydbacteria bacterium RIFCSPHIGHO2_01_FULL_49_22 TaxID=1798658 RepID=A0A1G2CXZ8_9BACT|nr:MAG: DEAD/DEAH box helicase [Candidatus Lloydbacteria bacterium RIFCSPHIGHO2_01_FULL_49_22]OGZ09778.1 MAG: DEAD/DEAH box helicase [Candidatus Lloydbacteria bacterium RIFCSPHIGHO2_02_FULL_50_18]